MDVLEIEKAFHVKLDDLNGKIAVKQRIDKELFELNSKIELMQLDYAVVEESRLVIAAVEETQQKQLKLKLERIITRALTAIFERNYKFELAFSDRGNQSDVTFNILNENGDAADLRNAHGGGLLVIVAFLLRTVIILSARPAMRRLIVHDEPFAQVSEEYRDKLVTFIQAFAKAADVQFVFVTHSQDLADIADVKYRFKLVNGLTQVERIND